MAEGRIRLAPELFLSAFLGSRQRGTLAGSLDEPPDWSPLRFYNWELVAQPT